MIKNEKISKIKDERVKKAMARLCSLPEKQQLYIAWKYYGGKMPWRAVLDE